jgi:ubiquinone/menaquinone biosynthesis C-methylase UbiE
MPDTEPGHDKAGTSSDYHARVAAEIEHYSTAFAGDDSQQTLMLRVPPIWNAIEARAIELIRQANDGRAYTDEILHAMRQRPGARALSLGSGPGGIELALARELKAAGHEFEILCLDINPHLVQLGQQHPDTPGLNISFAVQDINDLALPPEHYDVIMCHASLHHLVNLEHIFFEINRGLKPDGQLVVVDVVTRNGYRMWDETRDVVDALWAVLPEQFKYNHTLYDSIALDNQYPDVDYGAESMECIRSQDILPLLTDYFTCRVSVPHMSICRRFFDTMYGPNYDLSRALDRSVLEFIWQLDQYYITAGILKPETIFGVYTRGPNRERPQKSLAATPPPPVAQSTPVPSTGPLSEVATRDAIIASLQAALDEQTSWAKQSAAAITERDDIIRRLQAALDEQTSWAKQSAAAITERDALILELRAQLANASNTAQIGKNSGDT